MRDTFSTYHPNVNIVFFISVIGFAMVFLHPIFLGLGLGSSLAYSFLLNGKRNIKFSLIVLLPMMILAGLINPLFNHRGVTILRYIGNNPLTLESMLYGLAIAIMFGSVILWFSCVNQIMTSDKLMHIFGRLAPAFSMMFSMILRFVPRFKSRIQKISHGQKAIGRDVSDGSLKERIRHGIKIISIMVSWSLENAIDTADSMKSRGYGLPGRTSFAIYRFDQRDWLAMIWILALVGIVVAGAFLGENTIQYFPFIQVKEKTLVSGMVYSAYGLLCFTPVLLNILEGLKWRHLQSKI